MTIKQSQNSPIGVFDSGLGGLTVLKSLEKILPHESFIYFGDTAHVPYGTKSAETVTKYSRNILDFFLKLSRSTQLSELRRLVKFQHRCKI